MVEVDGKTLILNLQGGGTVVVPITHPTVGDHVCVFTLQGGGKCAVPIVAAIPPAGIGLVGGYYWINAINITTAGNATLFGELTVERHYLASFSSDTRGIWAGGSGDAFYRVIDYVTISTAGNATDFGLLTASEADHHQQAGCSNDTRGLIGGGHFPYLANIEYVTIATTGDAMDFGDLVYPSALKGACASNTRGIFAGGSKQKTLPSDPLYISAIDYVTIATTGDAADFGDLTVGRRAFAGCSSPTRGIFAGGVIESSSPYSNTIDYITIASLGDATDFGDLTAARYSIAGCSSHIRGVFLGGNIGGSDTNTIDYVTIATVGDATDFGDLTSADSACAGCSNCHGGL